MAMTKIESVLHAAAVAAAATAFVLAGASGAAAQTDAQTGIDAPAQAQFFGLGQAPSKPIVKLRPDASSWDQDRSAGPSFRVNVPLGGRARLPLTVRIRSANEAQETGIANAAADRDGDFVREAWMR
jgi:hypothetical protein